MPVLATCTCNIGDPASIRIRRNCGPPHRASGSNQDRLGRERIAVQNFVLSANTAIPRTSPRGKRPRDCPRRSTSQGAVWLYRPHLFCLSHKQNRTVAWDLVILLLKSHDDRTAWTDLVTDIRFSVPGIEVLNSDPASSPR